MCGICGAYFSRSREPVQPDLVKKMCAVIRHRGPDDEGMFLDGNIGLGMRRLSIIDLDSGSQPVFNEDSSVCVVFNGEIYNFQELRRELIRNGHQFKTRSDTEVIVHLYEEEGLQFPTRLNGMFAIALWDVAKRQLILVRDRLGVKPLYYAWTPVGLVFGSELKCLLQWADLPRTIDHQAVYHYFTLGYIPHPFTIYEGVRQLPPAHLLVAQDNTVRTTEYWRLDSRIDRSRSREDVCEELRELLTDAVRLRLISDVPLGAFLSGGLDSSITVALMAQQSCKPVKTFFIDFDEQEHSEREYARAVANRYGTDHQEYVVRPSAVEMLDELVDMFDEPFGDSSALPTFHVCRIARQDVTVALSGDGGDEAFGGYISYQRILKRTQLSQSARRLMRPIGMGVHHLIPRTGRGRMYFRSIGLSNHELFAVGTQELEARDLLTREFRQNIGDSATYELLRPILDIGDASDPLSPYTYLDTRHYLPDDILTKVDRMSMANSLELRSPFLDYRVVELAATIPADWKISSSGGKAILKQIFRKDLPDNVVNSRRKQGFSLPLAGWLRGALRPALEDALNDGNLASAGIIEMNEIQGIFREHQSGVRDRTPQLWNFLFFSRWWNKQQLQ